MGFHVQRAVETAHSADLEEAPLTHEESRGEGGGGGGGGGGWGFPQIRLIAGQTRSYCPWPCAVDRFFLTGCCYILISLHRVKLPLWRKCQVSSPREPRKLSSVGRHSTGANPRPPIWSGYTQQCLGCRLRCKPRGRVKSMPFRSLPMLARKILSRRLKMEY